jgi:hypothetical protein
MIDPDTSYDDLIRSLDIQDEIDDNPESKELDKVLADLDREIALGGESATNQGEANASSKPN